MIDQPVPDGQLSAEQIRPRSEPSQRIDARALRAWRVTGVLESAVIFLVAAGVSVIIRQLGLSWWIAGAVLALAGLAGVVLIWLVPLVRWRHWRYEVTEQQLDLQRGIVTLTRTVVPMVRVQHVDTKQGPILRRYGLASVEIATAAGTQEIPALAVDVADELRTRIARTAGVAEDV